MQDSSAFPAAFPEQEHLKCPRCDSGNTKFCYYNNYNLSQPRHFCKNCRRYWTKGGALRNIPVGGGTRKNAKRPSNPKRPNSDPDPTRPTQARRILESPPPQQLSSPQSVSNSDPDPTRKILDVTGSFSSLLASTTQFGSLLDGSGPKMVQLGDFTEDLNVDESGLNSGQGLDEPGNDGSDGYLLQNGESNCWGGGGGGGGGAAGNGWPDLAIYTPGSGFQ